MSQNPPPSLGALSAEHVVDVRETPPSERHPRIFGTFQNLEPGRSFILVNDHDPKPLYYQFQAEHTGTFSWDYLERGPRVWRVRIGKQRVASERRPIRTLSPSTDGQGAP
ncbi:MAG: DUF2249 domain-containing protein [Euryarchaeota archaeon]|nr:DUF2249 domain-containing protein [Euryarchaeota archaeon]MDE1837881.1 DUF2249 domain-containing protein [Euryarchaeota archaeon]MDE1881648.1 DUF2249 domain-containing protein [Euryarchaeota archaeon]MDE2046227.1 DUF2249 domain-containing protein [Thermoplasmata archaeon]